MTVTVNEQLVEVLPAASVAVQLTEVVPTGNVDPEAGTQVTVAPGQLSIAVAVKLTMAEHCPAVLPTVMFAGQLTVGG